MSSDATGTDGSSSNSSNSADREPPGPTNLFPNDSEANSADSASNIGSAPTNSHSSSKKKSRRRVQATELHFQVIQGRQSVARVAILLCNISDRPLFYKFKTDSMSCLSALPSATGHIAARGSSRVVFTWQRPKEKTWTELGTPKLLLITRFLDGSGKGDKDVTNTRLIANLDVSATCDAERPPLEQLLLDAVTKTLGKESNDVSVTKGTNSSSDQAVTVRPRAGSAEEAPNNGMGVLLVVLLAILALALYRLSNPPTQTVLVR